VSRASSVLLASVLAPLSQKLARDLLELLAVVLFAEVLAEPPPVDVADVSFAWISAELGAGWKMLDLIWADSKLFA
jgi:hypothetical protein